MVEIITENRELIMDKVTNASNEETSKYGIEVIDVRIQGLICHKKMSLQFMHKNDRAKEQANKFRSEGEEGTKNQSSY